MATPLATRSGMQIERIVRSLFAPFATFARFAVFATCLAMLTRLTLLPTGRAAAQQPPRTAAIDSTRPDTARATLIGLVVDSAGFGISGAEITLLKSDDVRAISGDSGSFRMTGLPAGKVVFSVRRIGYESATFTAILMPGKVHRTNFELSAVAQTLPAVAVSDTAINSHWLDQFNERRAHNRGTFITREDFVKRGARTGIDVIRMVPGLRIAPNRNSSGGGRVTMARTTNRACAPTMYLHGLPYSGTIEDFSADEIEAVEVYVGVSEIPAEFDRNNRGICGVIVVWTRDPRAAAARRP